MAYKCSVCGSNMPWTFAADKAPFVVRHLFSSNWSTIVFVCKSCDNDSALCKLKQKLPNWKITDSGCVQFGDDIDIVTAAIDASSNVCTHCGEPLGESVYTEGLRAFIPSHKGMYENVRKNQD